MTIYLDSGTFEETAKPFADLTREIVDQVPSMGLLLADVGECLVDGDYRGALDACFRLLEYEAYLEQVARGEIEPPPKGA